MSKRSDRIGGGLTSRSTTAAKPPSIPKPNPKARPASERAKTPSTHQPSSLTERRSVASIYYDKAFITPVWTKVSTTPWTALAKACGGYGRVVDGASISYDCPSFMQISEVMDHSPRITGTSEFGGVTRRKFRVRDKYSMSLDAPDWFTKTPSGKNGLGISKIIYGDRVMFEPKLAEEMEERIDWGDENRNSKRGGWGENTTAGTGAVTERMRAKESARNNMFN